LDIKTFVIIFGTVFMAELGDKTQLATLLFAADKKHGAAWVFLAAAAALVASTAIGVIAGNLLASYVNARHLSIVAGVGFIGIGAWTLWGTLR
jgi:putative Ca2+/H+ antiporter (TMEM165/GDT1 family)